MKRRATVCNSPLVPKCEPKNGSIFGAENDAEKLFFFDSFNSFSGINLPALPHDLRALFFCLPLCDFVAREASALPQGNPCL